MQSCYYIPPSLRPKPATTTTPNKILSPSIGSNVRGSGGYSSHLSNVKPPWNVTSSAKVHPSLNTGVHRNNNSNYEGGGVKYEKTYKTTNSAVAVAVATKQQPKYPPPGKYNTG